MDKEQTLKVLAEKIKEKTLTGELDWKPSTRAYTYKSTIGSGFVTVTCQDETSLYCEILFFNDRGELIGKLESKGTNIGGEYRNLIREIYDLAKNSYLKIDDTLNSMFSSLK